jgi:glycosyltransferase involved in cell wall biosynthesis
MIKVAILWTSFPGYVSKCIEALANYSSEIHILAMCRSEGTSPNTIINLKKLSNVKIIDTSSTKGSQFEDNKQIESFTTFAPDIALISLSRFGLFAKIARRLTKSGTMVIGACDNFWRGTWKDYGNWMIAKIGAYLQYEGILVPGALGVNYARKLNFKDPAIFQGLYSCDTEIFLSTGLNRHFEKSSTEWPKVFLFAGQYIGRKGLDILLKAYSIYRKESPEGWELWLVGEGPLKSLIKRYSHVKDLGFKEPEKLAETMKQSGCFILPSRHDHWPLVIHEATCAGLPILASNTCGSSIELVQNGYNGFTFPPGDPLILAKLMKYMAESGRAKEMAKHSLQLSYRYSPLLWAKRILVDVPLFLRERPLVES